MRHLSDDIYMTIRLAQWVRDRLQDTGWYNLKMGKLHFHAGSLHIFEADRVPLAQMHRDMTSAYTQRLSAYASGSEVSAPDE
jgi:hypothetical protein